jgi:DNA-binding MarR family transcriptional regulator
MVHPRGAVISPERLLTDEIGRGIMRVRRLMLIEAGKRLDPQGHSVLAWQALNLLDRLGPVPQGALAEGLGQHAPGISRLVDELARDRLIKRGRNRLDRRVVVVSLARRGKTRLEVGRPLVEAAVERVLAPLDQTDRRALRNLLWRMIPQK